MAQQVRRLENETPRRNDGFTLVELLVVIAIIGVLATALLPAIGLVRGKANQIADRKNLEKIFLNLSAYAQSKNGLFPHASKEGASSVDHLQELLKDQGVLENFDPKVLCSPVQTQVPASVDDGKIKLTPDNVSYTFSAKRMRENQTKTPLMSNSTMKIGTSEVGFPKAVHVLFPDGNVNYYQTTDDEAAKILDGFIFPKNLVDQYGKGPEKLPADG